jgi:hypothetical protein
MSRLAIALAGAAASMAAVASVGTTACTLSPTTSDAGADAGTETVGDQCATIGAALCAAYGMCAQGEPTDCTENFNAGCCAGATCNEISQTSADAVQTCVADYVSPTLDCNALANSTTPSDCTGIPQP